MSALISSIGTVFRLGPREYTRQKFKLPLVKFIHETVNLYKSRTRKGVNNVKEVLFRGTVIALIAALLVWLSIFMYIAFYYVYVPTISHERPVHLKFKPCGATYDCVGEKGLCSFPAAHVKLTKRQQLLMIGQPYKIHLELDMPESPTNRQLGMFMVCVEFMSKTGNLVNSSCRSAMLYYRGIVLDTIYKLFFSPFFVFGSALEKQTVKIELFSDYEEKDDEPVTDIYVEVQTRHIEIYSAKFTVNAQFSGLRYVMFHWPVLSAAMGITANLFFVAVVCLISWYQIIHSDEYLEYIQTSRKQGIDNEEDVGFLESILNSDLGTLPFIPMFIGFDTCSNVCSYFARRFLTASNVPIRLIRFIIQNSEYDYFDQIQNDSNDNVASIEDVTSDNKIECAKHRKSGCELCLANNELMFLT